MEKAADQHTTSPPAYTPPPSNPYPNAGYSPTPYPTPAPGPAPGPTPYPPPPAQYPPPPTGQPPYGQAYGYGQQPAGYPPQPGYGTPQYVGAPPPQQPQQQQQQVVVVSAGQQPVIVRHVQSYAGHIIFSCFVLWCCNPLFGLIAFILAVVASSTAVDDPQQARRLGNASMGLSIAGIVVIIVVAIIVGVLVANAASSCIYRKGGECYSYRTNVNYYGSCDSGERYGSYCYYNY